MTGPRITCIIPAYNEAPRIGAVLDVVGSHPMIAEAIVVDDASTDGTADLVAGCPRVDLLRLPVNGGKTRAVAAGLARARGEFVLLVDSDLIGLATGDLDALIAPVLSGRAGMSISLRRNAPRLWHRIGIDYISGERLFRRDLVAGRLAELQALPRFGLEVWLNRICVAESVPLAIVPWGLVDSPTKGRKFGPVAGAMRDAGMIADMVRAAGPLQLLQQIIRMRQQRIESA